MLKTWSNVVNDCGLLNCKNFFGCLAVLSLVGFLFEQNKMNEKFGLGNMEFFFFCSPAVEFCFCFCCLVLFVLFIFRVKKMCFPLVEYILILHVIRLGE